VDFTPREPSNFSDAMGGSLNVIDYAVLVAYLAGTIVLGLMLSRKIKTGKDLFLAGRALPWWAVGFSLVATDIGGTDIIGVGGAAYVHGMAVGNFEWIGCVPAMIVAAFIFIPLFWRAGVYTIPEFLERRYNASVRSALATCWFIFMACNLGIMLYASARMLNVLFGWDPLFAILLTAALVGIYTYFGGLAAVVYTDVLQCIIMIGGCLLVLFLGLNDVGGISGLMEKVRAVEAARTGGEGASGVIEHTRLILPVDTKTPFPWTGIFFGLGLILGPAYWIGNQAIVQRALGARSEFDAKASYVWGALLKNLVPFIVAVPGLIALAKYPDLASGDDAVPTLVARMLPVGLKGLFLAAFMAALMSSIDSYLNSAATLLTNDLYKRFLRRNATDEHLLRVGRIVTVVLILWGIIFALMLGRIESSGIYAIFQTLMAFFQGPAFAILIAGILWRRATGVGALVGFIGGVCCTVTLFALNQEAIYSQIGWQPLFKISEPFLYFSIWGFLVALVQLVVVSLFTRAEPEERIASLVYRWRETKIA
jgi:SSS family solute:Na+ symporter